MVREIYEVTKERFSLKKPNYYLLQGTWPKEYDVKVYLDQIELEASIENYEPVSVMERMQDMDAINGEKVEIGIFLPEDLSSYKKLKIYAEGKGEKLLWFAISSSELMQKMGKPFYFIEEEIVSGKNCRIRGWAVYKTSVKIGVYDEHGQKIDVPIQRTNRVDVQQMFSEASITDKPGFFVEIPDVKGKVLYLVFYGKDSKIVYPVALQKAVIIKKKVEKYGKKGIRYLKIQGPAGLAEKISKKIKVLQSRPVHYEKWIQKHLPGKKELDSQRKEQFAINPKISVVVPLYKTPEVFLRRLVESLQEQTYSNWELCLSDGSGENSPIQELLRELQEADARVRVTSSVQPLQISENTNQAISIASGEYIAFADHDDELTPNALYECVKVINRTPDVKIIYSDEDKMSMDGHKFFQPHFKPDLNIDLLHTVNYICHLCVIERTTLEKAGLLRSEFDGAQDYDLVFRCIEQVSERQVVHIPKILYHWRSHEDSTAENPESKRYAFEAGARAIEEHYKRTGVSAKVYEGEFPGLYRTRYLRSEDPLISIIIPNKDHIDDLERCISSIEQNSTYRNYEYIIVENNSTEDSTFQYYKSLEETNPKVRVVYWDGEFNFSAINNFGAEYAKGEYLLLLNNDTQIINADCIEELLGYCMRADVGAVGARLYYEDDTIQHAGVVIGFGGIAGHCFVQQPRGYTGYCHRIICAQNYSAVTAACMMVKKKAFKEVEGLSEELKVAFNDIDFCLKLQKAGYRIVYNPYAELYHYESKSRGFEDTPEKVARFHNEIMTFEKKWSDIMKAGDPYYNPNLTLNSQDFSLKRI